MEQFADPLIIRRTHRASDLTAAITHYAARLAHHCHRAPLDWFNFYDFWH
jgi:predicted LPLAT superfamily acyltransferase